MKIEYLKPAAFVINNVFCVKPGETVLVVTDTNKQEFAEPFMAAAHAAGAEAIVMTMTPRRYPGEPLPSAVNDAIRASDVVIGCVSYSIYGPILSNINSDPNVKTRGGSISNITDRVMMGGGLWADPEEVMRITNGVYEVARRASRWRLTTASGTDLSAQVGSCRIVERQPMSEPRMVGALPGCEVALDPAPGTAEGTFYSDGSCGVLTSEVLGYAGILNEPIKCTVAGGTIVDVDGGKEARVFREIMNAVNDPCAFIVSHLAIGCNPNSRMTGDYINDEKIAAGVHIAHAGTGGCPAANVDHCFQHPSLWLDGVQVIDDWRFVGPMEHLQPS